MYNVLQSNVGNPRSVHELLHNVNVSDRTPRSKPVYNASVGAWYFTVMVQEERGTPLYVA